MASPHRLAVATDARRGGERRCRRAGAAMGIPDWSPVSLPPGSSERLLNLPPTMLLTPALQSRRHGVHPPRYSCQLPRNKHLNALLGLPRHLTSLSANSARKEPTGILAARGLGIARPVGSTSAGWPWCWFLGVAPHAGSLEYDAGDWRRARSSGLGPLAHCKLARQWRMSPPGRRETSHHHHRAAHGAQNGTSDTDQITAPAEANRLSLPSWARAWRKKPSRRTQLPGRAVLPGFMRHAMSPPQLALRLPPDRGRYSS